MPGVPSQWLPDEIRYEKFGLGADTPTSALPRHT